MQYRFGLLFAVLLLSACGTRPFTPEEYPLGDGLVPSFPVTGAARVRNLQSATDPVLVYDSMGAQFTSDLKSLTQVMVQQTQEELQKDGRPAGPGSPKVLDIQVKSLLSHYTYFFFWKSRIDFSVTLGNGETLAFSVPHTGSSIGQDLDGCIAEGVLTLLTDNRVKAYLAGS